MNTLSTVMEAILGMPTMVYFFLYHQESHQCLNTEMGVREESDARQNTVEHDLNVYVGDVGERVSEESSGDNLTWFQHVENHPWRKNYDIIENLSKKPDIDDCSAVLDENLRNEASYVNHAGDQTSEAQSRMSQNFEVFYVAKKCIWDRKQHVKTFKDMIIARNKNCDLLLKAEVHAEDLKCIRKILEEVFAESPDSNDIWESKFPIMSHKKADPICFSKYSISNSVNKSWNEQQIWRSISKFNGKYTSAIVEYFAQLKKTSFQTPVQIMYTYPQHGIVQLQATLQKSMSQNNVRNMIARSKWTSKQNEVMIIPDHARECKVYDRVNFDKNELLDGQNQKNKKLDDEFHSEHCPINFAEDIGDVHNVVLKNNKDSQLRIKYNSEIPSVGEIERHLEEDELPRTCMEKIVSYRQLAKPIVGKNAEHELQKYHQYLNKLKNNKTRLNYTKEGRDNELHVENFVKRYSDRESKGDGIDQYFCQTVKYHLTTNYVEQAFETTNWKTNGKFLETSQTQIKYVCTQLVESSSPKDCSSFKHLDCDAMKDQVQNLLNLIERVELPTQWKRLNLQI